MIRTESIYCTIFDAYSLLIDDYGYDSLDIFGHAEFQDYGHVEKCFRAFICFEKISHITGHFGHLLAHLIYFDRFSEKK